MQEDNERPEKTTAPFLAMPSVLYFTGLANLFFFRLGRYFSAFRANKIFPTLEL